MHNFLPGSKQPGLPATEPTTTGKYFQPRLTTGLFPATPWRPASRLWIFNVDGKVLQKFLDVRVGTKGGQA